ALDAAGFYRLDAFPGTEDRMRLYKEEAFRLARKALDQIDEITNVTHIIVTSCTGLFPPGLDLQIVKHYGISPSAERTINGVMGCYAAVNALKTARHIVRSEPGSRVLVLNHELCTLHLRNTG